MAERPPPLVLALFEPDIAQNAGAMMRTCACLGVGAAIIEPAGFRMGDSRFRRAGMDYLDALTIEIHDSWGKFATWRASTQRRLALLTTKGETSLWDFAFREGDIILVGREFGWVAGSRERIGRLPAAHPDSAAAALPQCGNRGDNRHDRSLTPTSSPAVHDGTPGVKGRSLETEGVTTTVRSAIVVSVCPRKR